MVTTQNSTTKVVPDPRHLAPFRDICQQNRTNENSGLLFDSNALQCAHPKLAYFCSASMVDFYAAVDTPHVQFSFTNFPKPIKEAFATEAQKRHVAQNELLYECLRAGGIDIPDAAEIDGRRK